MQGCHLPNAYLFSNLVQFSFLCPLEFIRGALASSGEVPPFHFKQSSPRDFLPSKTCLLLWAIACEQVTSMLTFTPCGPSQMTRDTAGGTPGADAQQEDPRLCDKSPGGL